MLYIVIYFISIYSLLHDLYGFLFVLVGRFLCIGCGGAACFRLCGSLGISRFCIGIGILWSLTILFVSVGICFLGLGWILYDLYLTPHMPASHSHYQPQTLSYSPYLPFIYFLNYTQIIKITDHTNELHHNMFDNLILKIIQISLNSCFCWHLCIYSFMGLYILLYFISCSYCWESTWSTWSTWSFTLFCWLGLEFFTWYWTSFEVMFY